MECESDRYFKPILPPTILKIQNMFGCLIGCAHGNILCAVVLLIMYDTSDIIKETQMLLLG